MTIQISVLIWTIICFVLLMLILHNLLFKPVLRVMDKRQERIHNAAVKKAALEKKAEEHAAFLKEQETAFQEQQKQLIKQEIETIRAGSKKTVDAVREERLHMVEDCRTKAVEERGQLLEVLGTHTAELASAFADSIIKE